MSTNTVTVDTDKMLNTQTAHKKKVRIKVYNKKTGRLIENIDYQTTDITFIRRQFIYPSGNWDSRIYCNCKGYIEFPGTVTPSEYFDLSKNIVGFDGKDMITLIDQNWSSSKIRFIEIYDVHIYQLFDKVQTEEFLKNFGMLPYITKAAVA